MNDGIDRLLSAPFMDDPPREPYDLSDANVPSNRPLRRLRCRLKRAFPRDVAKADTKFSEVWDFDRHEAIHGDWLSRFADTTSSAMTRRDEATVDGHMALISSAYRRGGSYLRSLIDVNYVENLFYKVSDANARWGWQRVPCELQQLYVNMWGSIIPRFVDRLEPSAPGA